MFHYKVRFLALTDTTGFEIKTTSPNHAKEFLDDLFFAFSKVNEQRELTVPILQKNSKELQSNVDALNDKYKHKHHVLNIVPAYFKKLKENESFFFLPGTDFDAIENSEFYYILEQELGGDFSKKSITQTRKLFGGLLKKYQVATYGEKRISIGHKIKSERVCRFCNEKQPNVSFRKKAHAISEGLGNKTVILYDECDDCNFKFSQSIEPDLIQYVSLLRTFYSVQGKGGVKQFKGKNFILKNEEGLSLTFYSDEDKPESHSMPYKLPPLISNELITSQNIYKTLCKYFLSVVDEKYLPEFKKTIEWINGKTSTQRLPKIGEMITYNFFSKQPKLVTYIRRGNSKTLPFAVGEFHFTCLVITFIIPFASGDSHDFVLKKDFDVYRKAFKHYTKAGGWTFKDYSNNKPKEFSISLNFELNNKSNKK